MLLDYKIFYSSSIYFNLLKLLTLNDGKKNKNLYL